MAMTVTEKILAKKSGKGRVVPGEIVICQVDLACVDDIQFPIFHKTFAQIAKRVWDREKAVLIVDHYLPPANVDQAETIKAMKAFGLQHGLRHIFLNEGIKHQVFRAHGLVLPGMILAATDSHTNTGGAFGALAIALGPTDVAAIFKEGKIWLRVPETIRFEIEGDLPPMVSAKDIALDILGAHGVGVGRYKALEFAGPAIERLSLDGRMTLCNMSTEMGAKNGIIQPDEKTLDYAQKTGRPFEAVTSDPEANYAAIFKRDVSQLEPLIGVPFSPDNVQPVSAVEGTKVDQAFIGTCTSSSLEDLEVAARILEGKKVNPYVRLLVIPPSKAVYEQALAHGLLGTLSEAGAIICNPNCGPCAGLHQGTLASDEVMISTQSRNFRGRAGDITSKIYLASAATVAASAIEGKVVNPQRFIA